MLLTNFLISWLSLQFSIYYFGFGSIFFFYGFGSSLKFEYGSGDPVPDPASFFTMPNFFYVFALR